MRQVLTFGRDLRERMLTRGVPTEQQTLSIRGETRLTVAIACSSYSSLRNTGFRKVYLNSAAAARGNPARGVVLQDPPSPPSGRVAQTARAVAAIQHRRRVPCRGLSRTVQGP